VRVSPAMVESVISAAVSKVRNMRDENGYPMGYTADTIVIPCDDPALESAVKKVLGSEFLGGEGGMLSGSINLHYGNWNLIIDPLWQRSVATSHPMIIFSSAARRNLQAAMFFDRTPLDVSDFVDEATLDYMWTGYARMSAGFVTHKWGCLVDILDSGTTALFDGAATGEGGAATAQSAVLTL